MSALRPAPVPRPAASGGVDYCDLGPEALQERIAMVRREIRPRVLRSESLGDGIAWEFETDPETRGRVEDWVALERQCCGGLDWRLTGPPAHAALRLEVRGVDPGDSLLGQLTGAPEPPGDASGGRLGRLARAGGLGLGLSFLVFCGLPIAAAAFFGASAAPLLGLDEPLYVGLGALALGLPAWWLLRRREERREAAGTGCGPGC